MYQYHDTIRTQVSVSVSRYNLEVSYPTLETSSWNTVQWFSASAWHGVTVPLNIGWHDNHSPLLIKEKKTHAVWSSGQNGRVDRRQENSDCSSPEWVKKAGWATLHLLDGHSEERPSSAQPYTWRVLSNWLWISRCGDYWQQAELRTDVACRIMMMMMMTSNKQLYIILWTSRISYQRYFR